MPSEILPANFTISAAGKRGIEMLRAEYDLRWPDDPAAVACVAWSIVVPDNGPQSQTVMVGFYQRSMVDKIAHGIQEVSGVKLVFFTTEEFYGKFDGRVLDHTGERGFFLRAP